MIREEDERMKLDRVEPLGSSEDPDDDGLQVIGGLEQKAALHCPTRHFDQGAAFGDVPQSPCHALEVALHSHVLAESDGTSSGNLAPQAVRVVGEVAREAFDALEPPFQKGVLECPVRLIL